jgi:hypothetical protein
MVGMIILGIGLMGTAGMTVVAARRASGLATQSSRSGIVLQELNKLAVMPHDLLSTRVGCSAVTSGSLAYTRCIAVTDVASGRGYRRIRLIVTPSAAGARPDTVFLNRAWGGIPVSVDPF